MSGEKRWFKAKTYGWGWVPATWQGWLIVLVYAIINSIPALWLVLCRGSSVITLALVLVGTMALSTAALIRICCATGEEPKWRWGKN